MIKILKVQANLLKKKKKHNHPLKNLKNRPHLKKVVEFKVKKLKKKNKKIMMLKMRKLIHGK